MGQAKARGTYEQRKSMAISRVKMDKALFDAVVKERLKRVMESIGIK